jgi:microcin C transport system substrate-binding protein
MAIGTFDNFNGVVAGVKGALVADIGLIYDRLTVPSLDEPSSAYGLLAEAVSRAADFSSVSYLLRAEAKWHDGVPVTPDDVIFSFEALRQYSPQQAAYYRQGTDVERTGEREITFTFAGPGNRELPQIVDHDHSAWRRLDRQHVRNTGRDAVA